MKNDFSSDLSDMSDPSDKSDSSDHLIPKHGGYRRLRSFHAAQLVYDGTLVFCDRFVAKRSRTHDQMVQAARSGVQNIAEGSMASGTSKKFELKLTGVARASLEELLLDFEDFLRQRGLRRWTKESPEALAVRRKYKSDSSDKSDQSDSSDRSDASDRPDPYSLRSASPEIAANTLICLVNQASYLLGRQLRDLEAQFLDHGGFTERLYAARRGHMSGQSDKSDKSDRYDKSDAPNRSPTPPCPRCGAPMIVRTARRGPNAGQCFWGCSTYPACTGTRRCTDLPEANLGVAPAGRDDKT